LAAELVSLATDLAAKISDVLEAGKELNRKSVSARRAGVTGMHGVGLRRGSEAALKHWVSRLGKVM